MRCSQAEHLLSLNLDGRLSSGQRRVLSEHLAGCERCASVDRELNEARDLALSLPMQRPSEGFREELWERIRSGEGTPEAVFREPIPLATKVRYFTTGAAAAGLLILAAHTLRPRSVATPVPEARSSRSAQPLAAGLAPVVPATPDRLASLVADGYTEAVQKLHAKARALEASQVPPEGLETLREQADRARRFAGLLRWMVDGKYLLLLQDDAASLRAIEMLGEQVYALRDADSLRRVLQPIHSLRVEQPRSFFCNPCVEDESGFYREFLRRLHQLQLDHALGSKLQLVTEPTPGGPARVMVFVRN
jgi:hypothetical protein